MFVQNYTKTLRYLKKLSNINLLKLGTTSNASQAITRWQLTIPYQSKFKKLLFTKPWAAGRTSTGKITVFTKGSRSLKASSPFLNYSFRDSSLSIVGGFNYISSINKVSTLIFTSSGYTSYVPSVEDYTLFTFFKLNSLLRGKVYHPQKLFYKCPFMFLLQLNYIILRQLKNKPISLVESVPLGGIQLTRSTGSRSFIQKRDSRTGLSILVLSSGLKKIISIYSLASNGPSGSSILKKNFKNTKFGFFSNRGKKSKVRGVAKNPVDHPHGGRTNSIKYPRTPWGKTTKFK